MLDRVLMFVVVMGPTAFAIGVEVASESIRKHRFWRYGIMVFGFLLSGLTWWQISRQENNAIILQEAAIERVATETSEKVTKVVSGQYQEVVKSLTDQIGTLKGQLSDQGKKVDAISASNIVTNKDPVKVEITNPTATAGTNSEMPHVANVFLTWEKQESIDRDAPYCNKVILQSDISINPAAFLISFSAPVKSVVALGIEIPYVGKVAIDQKDQTVLNILMQSSINSLLKPESPLVFLVCSDNYFKPTKLVRAIVQ